jgi:putative membrane protein
MKLTTLQLAAFAAVLSIQPLVAQEMKPKPAGDAAPMMTIDKPTFVKMVTSSNEFEIRSSELATQNADQAGLRWRQT